MRRPPAARSKHVKSRPPAVRRSSNYLPPLCMLTADCTGCQTAMVTAEQISHCLGKNQIHQLKSCSRHQHSKVPQYCIFTIKVNVISSSISVCRVHPMGGCILTGYGCKGDSRRPIPFRWLYHIRSRIVSRVGAKHLPPCLNTLLEEIWKMSYVLVSWVLHYYD